MADTVIFLARPKTATASGGDTEGAEKPADRPAVGAYRRKAG